MTHQHLQHSPGVRRAKQDWTSSDRRTPLSLAKLTISLLPMKRSEIGTPMESIADGFNHCTNSQASIYTSSQAAPTPLQSRFTRFSSRFEHTAFAHTMFYNVRPYL